jgi:hypothetical protein
MDVARSRRGRGLALFAWTAVAWLAAAPGARAEEPVDLASGEIRTGDGRLLQYTFDTDEESAAAGLPYVLTADEPPIDEYGNPLDPAAIDPGLVTYDDAWPASPYDGPQPRRWQLLPDGLLYPSYLAGVQEPRLGSTIFHEDDLGTLWDAAVGGRVGIARFGTPGPRGEGFQLDAEGAAFPRLDLDHEQDLMSVDFRGGMPLTWREGPFETKLAYYHTSSHLGDEFIVSHPEAVRINYVRDAIVLGSALRPTPDWRLYAEAGYAFHTSGGAEPWEFQFGAEYSPLWADGCGGSPFLAANALLREEVDFSGHFVLQTGWQWRSPRSGSLLRLGFHYLNGKSSQQQFFNTHEQQIGGGLWFDY